MKQSAGILLWRRDGDIIRVLLGHPGGPFFARRDAGAWSIPKGEIEPRADSDLEPGSAPELEAMRELREETGLDVSGAALVPLGTIKQAGGKLVHGFACEGDLDPAAFHSNTFRIEWPKGSGTAREFPELDRVAWFTLADAELKINPAQVTFLERLRARLDEP